MKRKKIITVMVVVVMLATVLAGATSVADKTSTAEASESATAAVQPEYIEKLFNKDKVTEINIDINQADWEWLLENATKKEARSCDITVNGTTFYNVAINPKGNSSLAMIASDESTDRFSLLLDFGAYVEGQTCFGLEKLALNNGISDKSYMKEALSYDLFEYLGVATPAYAYADTQLNGKDWGLFLAVEVVDETFIQRHFGTTEGNLYKPESMAMDGADGGGFPNGGERPQNAEPANEDNQKGAENQAAEGAMKMPGGMGAGKGADLKYNGDSASNYSTIKDGAVFKTTSDGDFEKVITMIKALDNGTDIEKYLDVDEVLRYFAANTFLVNLDSYAGGMFHNYYLYEKEGVFKILPWDLNMSFAGMNMSDGTKAINFPIDVPISGKLEDAPLIGKLLEVPEYKALYHSYLKEISEKYIAAGVYEDAITSTDKLINSYVEKDATALYTYEDYKKAVPMMLTFGNDRAKSIDAQLNGAQSSTTYGTLPSTVDLSILGGMEMGGQKMQGAVGKAAMPDMANMQPIMKIMQEANGKELTDQQKVSLKALGVDENMLNMMKNMGNGGGFSPMGNPSMMQIGTIGLSVASLFIGMLIVFKFRRKKFRSEYSRAAVQPARD